MWWMLAAQAAVGVYQGLKQKSASEKANKQAKKNAENENLVRVANNDLAAAVGSLQRYRQSTNNQQILKAGASQREALTTNLLRQKDALSTGGFQRRIAASEEAGSLSATIGAAGMRGSTYDMLASAQGVRDATREHQYDLQEKQLKYDTLQQINGVSENTILSLDGSVFVDNINQNIPQASKVGVQSTTGVVGSSLFNTAVKNRQAISDYFG